MSHWSHIQDTIYFIAHNLSKLLSYTRIPFPAYQHSLDIHWLVVVKGILMWSNTSRTYWLGHSGLSGYRWLIQLQRLGSDIPQVQLAVDGVLHDTTQVQASLFLLKTKVFLSSPELAVICVRKSLITGPRSCLTDLTYKIRYFIAQNLSKLLSYTRVSFPAYQHFGYI